MVVEGVTVSTVVKLLGPTLAKAILAWALRKEPVPALDRAITQTCRFYEEVENLEANLRAWLSSEVIVELCDQVMVGTSDVSGPLVEAFLATEFYYGEDTESIAADIVSWFLHALQEGLLADPTTSASVTVSRFEAMESRLTQQIQRTYSAEHLGSAPQLTAERFSGKLEMIDQMMEGGRYASALDAIASTLNSSTDLTSLDRFRLSTKRALCLLSVGRTSDACNELEFAQKILPSKPEGVLNMVTAARLRGDLEQANAYWTAASQMLPDDPYLHAAKLWLLTDSAERESYLRGLSGELGSHPVVVFNYIEILLGSGEPEAALDLIGTLSNSDRDNLTIAVHEASCLFDIARRRIYEDRMHYWQTTDFDRLALNEVERRFEMIYEQLLGQQQPNLLRSVVLQRLLLLRFTEQGTEAHELWQKHSELLGATGDGLASLAAIQALRSDWTGAASSFRRARELDDCREPVDLLLGEAWSLFRGGQSSEAIKLISTLTPELLNDEDLAAAAQTVARCGSSAEDYKLWLELVQARGAAPSLVHAAALLLNCLGSQDEALTVLRRHANSTPWLRSELAELLLESGNYEEAAAELSQIATIGDDSPWTRRLVFALYRAGKDRSFTDAVKAFGEGVLLNWPQLGEMQLNVALRSGDMPQVESLARKLFELCPDRGPEHRFFEANACFRQFKWRAYRDLVNEDTEWRRLPPALRMRLAEMNCYVGLGWVELAYSACLDAPDDPAVALTFVNLMVRHEPDLVSFDTSEVSLDSTITIQRESIKATATIVLDSLVHTGSDEVGVSSARAVAFLGKRVGQSVIFDPGNVWTIKDISSKYVGLCRSLGVSFESRFPDSSSFRTVSGDIENDIIPKMIASMWDKESISSKILDLARRREIGPVLLSINLGISIVDLLDDWRALAALEVPLWVSNVAPSLNSIIDREHAGVLDISSLALLEAIDHLSVLQRFHIVVHQSLVDFLIQDMINAKAKTSGSFGSHKGLVYYVSSSEEVSLRRIARLERMLRAIQEWATVVPLFQDNDLLQVDDRAEILVPQIRVLQLAAEMNLPPILDDAYIQQVVPANYLNAQMLVFQSVSSKELDLIKYRQVVGSLSRMGVKILTLSVDDLVWSLSNADGLAVTVAMLGQLSPAEVSSDSAIAVASKFLLAIYSGQTRELHRILLDQVIRSVLTERPKEQTLQALMARILDDFALNPVARFALAEDWNSSKQFSELLWFER